MGMGPTPPYTDDAAVGAVAAVQPARRRIAMPFLREYEPDMKTAMVRVL